MILFVVEGYAMRRLHISKTDKKFLGVCGGIAETYDLDPTVVRIATVLLSLLTWIVPIAITYFTAYVVMPESDE